jgi:hypothetical protein
MADREKAAGSRDSGLLLLSADRTIALKAAVPRALKEEVNSYISITYVWRSGEDSNIQHGLLNRQLRAIGS